MDALPKGYPQGADGAREASESSLFQSAATFLAKIREQGIGASRAGLSRPMNTRIACLSITPPVAKT